MPPGIGSLGSSTPEPRSCARSDDHQRVEDLSVPPDAPRLWMITN